MKKVSQTEFSRLRAKTTLTVEEVAERTGFSVRTIYRWEKGAGQPRKAALDLLRKMVDTNGQATPLHPPEFRFIDLFAGIGGMRLGFESIGGKCVFTSEWDLSCQKTYLANFRSDHPVEGDITRIDEQDIPAHDVLLAGFPCQPFSIAGVSKKNALGRPHGFLCDTQGTLFFDVARIIAHHQPAAFLLENVKNLVNHDKRKTIAVIMRTLQEKLGYHVRFRVINAKGFVPQNRERIFIAGFREDTGFCLDSMNVPDPDEGPTLKTVLHTGRKDDVSPPYTDDNGLVSDKYTLTAHLWKYLQDYAAKHRARGNGFGFGLVGPKDVARTLSARYYKDGSEILVRQGRKCPRRLTPRECARLMGFDGPGRPPFEIPVSDTQAYKQFGNAVVVSVVEEVARHMYPHIAHSLGRASANQTVLPFEISRTEPVSAHV